MTTAVVLLWIFPLGLVSQTLWRWLEAPWQRRPAAAASSAEAIVVLSGGRHPAPGSARISEWQDPDRCSDRLQLMHAIDELWLPWTVDLAFHHELPDELLKHLEWGGGCG